MSNEALMELARRQVALALIEVWGGKSERRRAERLLARGEELHRRWRDLDAAIEAVWGSPVSVEDRDRITRGLYWLGLSKRAP